MALFYPLNSDCNTRKFRYSLRRASSCVQRGSALWRVLLRLLTAMVGVLELEGEGVSVGTAGSVALSDQRVSEMSHLKHAGFQPAVAGF